MILIPGIRAEPGGVARILRHPSRHLPAVALALLLLWAPLPFASADPGFAALLAAAGLALLAAAALGAPDLGALRPLAVPLAALGALAALALAQSAPLPRPVVAALSPVHAALYRDAGAILGAEAAPAPTLSLAPSASRRTALVLLAAAGFLALGALAARRREHRLWLGAAVVAGGVFQVLYGARGWLSGRIVVWGVELTSTDLRLHGTFVNVDHLATYLAIALAAAAAWVWWAVRRARREEATPERRLVLIAPPALAWAVAFAGLVFTGSRAGLAAALGATALQGVLAAAAVRRWRAAPLGLAAGAAGIGLIALLGARQGFGRLATTSPFEVLEGSRAQAYRACWELWRRFPWFGTGAGSFRDAFPLVQPEGLTGTWLHAHSDALELAVTTGLAGVAIVGVGLAFVLLRLGRVLWAAESSTRRAAALAALGALAAVGLQELFDFGLTVPANGFTLAIVCGAAAAAGSGHRAAR